MTAVSRGAGVSGRGWQPLALPRAVRMEPELDGEPELLTEIPANQNSDSPKMLPASSQGSASLELSVPCAWENSLGGGTHTSALLLLKRWGAQGDLRGRLTSGARVSWDTRELCQRGEVRPREHEPVPWLRQPPCPLNEG